MYNSNCLLLAEINHNSGNVVGMPQAFGDQGYQAGVDVEIIGNKAYIACEVGSCTYTIDTCSTAPVQSNFTWQSGQFISTSIVLSFDLNTYSRSNFINYYPNGFVMLDHQGTEIYILTNTKLDKLNVGSPTNFPTSSVNLPIRHATQSAAQYLHVSQAGDVYLTYPGLTQYHHGLERRNGNTLSLIDSKLYEYYVYIPNVDSFLPPTTYYLPARRPLAVTSIGNDVYLAHHITDTSGTGINTFAIEKLDLSATFGDSTWIIVSSANSFGHNVLQSSGDLVVTDLVPFKNDKMIFVSNFSSYQSNWQIQLGAKSLSRASGPFGDIHSIVALAEDLGTSGQYKQSFMPQVVTGELALYPNPTSGFTTVKCTETILECQIINAAGSTVISLPGIEATEVTFNAQNLVAGLYVVMVKSEKKVYVQKFLVQ